MSNTRKYSLTVKQYAGDMLLEYHANGVLHKFEQSLPFDAKQLRFLLKLVAAEQVLLDPSIQKEYGLTTYALKTEVTFDMFYDVYPKKRDKKKAETVWNKMKESERVKAFNYITKYVNTLPPRTEAKYPATYLNSECWYD